MDESLNASSDVNKTYATSVHCQFHFIIKRFAKLGLSNEVLISLQSFTELQNLSDDRRPPNGRIIRRRSGYSAAAATLVCLLFAALTISEKSILAWLADTDEQCLLSSDSFIADIFRPPVNCAKLCHDVTSIDHVTLSELDREQFEIRYAYTGRPVVVSGAMANWSATKTFNFEYFRSLYANNSKQGMTSLDECQFFAWGASEFATVSDAFQMDVDRVAMKNNTKPWYFGWSNCDSSVANVLRKQYTRPSFLPETSESSGTDWIFMGSPGYGAPIHVDNVGNPSWQAQVTGSKKWILEAPPECYMACVNRMEVTVNSGEISEYALL